MIYKVADNSDEIRQIHELNYQTFVCELKQHPENKEQMLIDRFHKENTYFICKLDEEVVGMIALRDQRPFSLDQKIESLDKHLPNHHKVFELRLLAIKPKFRRGFVLWNLVQGAMSYYSSKNYDLAIISGIITREKMYRSFGFTSFHPPITSGEAVYVPMFLTKERFLQLKHKILEPSHKRTESNND